MRYTPRFDSLESRTVPSTVSFNPLTATLTVTGTSKKDSIVIKDDGTNNTAPSSSPATAVRCLLPDRPPVSTRCTRLM